MTATIAMHNFFLIVNAQQVGKITLIDAAFAVCYIF